MKLQVTTFGKPQIKRLAEAETPSYRANLVGFNALSLSELISILIGDAATCMEISQAIIEKYKTPVGIKRASVQELAAIPGIGLKRAQRIQAAFNLGERLHREEWQERVSIHSPADAANLLMYEMSALPVEELRAILLDTRNCVISVETIYKGGVQSASIGGIRTAEIFRTASIKCAISMVLVHNHPSGDPNPSPEDVATTRAVVQAGMILDITVLDHIIVGGGRWISLKERGLGFTQ